MKSHIDLFEHQRKAVDRLKTGSILYGGVGSGKSFTALAYYFEKVCGGVFKPWSPRKRNIKLYIITTAKKRDSLDWVAEASRFLLEKDYDYIVDSWNNISKYTNEANSFFIFDEQRVVGSGAWVKSFYKICKKNDWILLSATPGDTWSDYIPVFVANGFYKNKTEFIRRHVVYKPYVTYPVIDRYVDTGILQKHRHAVLVPMPFKRSTTKRVIRIDCAYDKKLYDGVVKNRWDPFQDRPVKNAAEWFHLQRKIVNSDPSRTIELQKIYSKHKRVIVFYNFNYELEILRDWAKTEKVIFSEWNGQKHEPIPKEDTWVYLVQYTAGAEGWECIETDTICFYSQNYSYKMTTQASGRTDRLNTPHTILYDYKLVSNSMVDYRIYKAWTNKKDFVQSWN